jgi:peptidoglycan/LPS O-acetylase OafA/YrhL
MWLNMATLFDPVTLFDVTPPQFRLLQQTWSLQIEILFYLLIGLATHRSEPVTYALLAIALAAAAASLFKLIDYRFYWSMPGNAFMFYAGSSAYFLMRRGVTIPIGGLVAAALAYAAAMFGLPHTVTVAQYSGWWPHSFLFVSAVAVFFILLGLPNAPALSPAAARATRVLGRLAYPVFLLHIAFGAVINAAIGEQKFWVLSGSMVLTLVAAAGIVRFVEVPIEGIRQRTREHGLALAAPRWPGARPVESS